MGLSSMMQGGLEAVGGTMAKIGTEQLLTQQKAEIEALRDARLQELKLEFDATTRSRNVADATTERARVDAEAVELASRRKVTPPEVEAQTDASAIALHSAQAAGTLPPGALETGLIGLSKYATDAAVPDARVRDEDRLNAKGDYAGAANVRNQNADNERRDRVDERAGENVTLDNIRADRQVAVQEGNLERANALADKQLEMLGLQVDQARETGKIPPAVLLEYNKKKTELEGVIRDITAARKTGMPVDKAALDEKTAIADEMSRMIAPYMPEGKGAPAAPAAGMQDVRVGGKVIGQASTKAEADALVAKHKAGGKPAAKAPDGIISGPAAGRPVQPDASDFANVEAAKAARKAKADREEAERTEANRKRSAEIDKFNAAMKR